MIDQENITSHENEPTHEIAGVAALLMLGGKFRSELTSEDQTQITRIAAGEIPIPSEGINAHTLQQRKAAWEGKTQDEAMTEWKNDMDNFLAYYQGKDEEIFLKELGITVDEGADGVYKKFMIEQKGDVTKFVDEILRTYPAETIRKNIDLILSLGDMYAEDGKIIIALLTEGILEARADTNKFIATAQAQMHLGEDMPGYELLTRIAPPEQPEQNPHYEREDRNEEPHLSPNQIADKLLDYQTGAVKTDANVDLKESYISLIEDVFRSMQTDPSLFPTDKPIVVLSDVAKAMIDKIATESNRRNQEFAFTIQGGYIQRGSGQPVFVGAFAVPASDFSNPQAFSVELNPDIQRQAASALAQQTGVGEVFEHYQKSHRGIAIGALHIHYAALGDGLTATPSRGDYQQGEAWLHRTEADPAQPNPLWGVVTKTPEGELLINIVRTYRRKHKNSLHEDSPEEHKEEEIVHEEQLPVLYKESLRQVG